MNVLLNNIKLKILEVLLFIMVVFPMTYELLHVKTFLFVVVTTITAIEVLFLKKYIIISKKVAFILLIFLSYSILSCMYGMVNNAPGAMKQFQIYVLWSIIYMFIMLGLNDRDYRKLGKVILYSTLFIMCYGFLKYLNYTGIISFNFAFNFPSFEEAIKGQGLMTEMRYPGLNSMSYGIGYILGIVYINTILNKKKLLNSILVLSLMVFIIISGRRVYGFIILIVTFILLCVKLVKNISRRRIFLFLFFTIASSLVLIKLFNINIYVINEYIFSSLSKNDSDSMLRYQQLYALLEGWLQNPVTFLIGHGHGSFSTDVIRSIDMPWSYELYYIALIFQTGIIGFIIYSSFFIMIIINGIKIIKDTSENFILLPFFTGVMSLLIASATNPYMMRFDGIWAIFIALGIINCFNKDKIKVQI